MNIFWCAITSKIFRHVCPVCGHIILIHADLTEFNQPRLELYVIPTAPLVRIHCLLRACLTILIATSSIDTP